MYKVWRDKKQNVTKLVIDPWALLELKSRRRDLAGPTPGLHLCGRENVRTEEYLLPRKQLRGSGGLSSFHRLSAGAMKKVGVRGSRLESGHRDPVSRSTGKGDEGEMDSRGPWNQGGDWQIVEVPELKEVSRTWKPLKASVPEPAGDSAQVYWIPKPENQHSKGNYGARSLRARPSFRPLCKGWLGYQQDIGHAAAAVGLEHRPRVIGTAPTAWKFSDQQQRGSRFGIFRSA
jgi:hypothetical protein